MLKFPPKLFALVGRHRLDIFRSAPGLVEDIGDRADRMGVSLQAAVTLEDLFLGSEVLVLLAQKTSTTPTSSTSPHATIYCPKELVLARSMHCSRQRPAWSRFFTLESSLCQTYNCFSGGTTNTHLQAPGMTVPPLYLGLVI
jgi:hypothetical protein